jgi:PrtD family type I secretion system ABC transporter
VGQSVIGVLDTVWSPLFILVGYLIHPVLGAIGTFGAIGLLTLSFANEFLMREPQKEANLLGIRASEMIEASARSAEVVSALGMGPALLKRIKGIAEQGRAKSDYANSLSTNLSGTTRIFRLFIQLSIMCVGVWLVLADHLTAGAVFAASMIMGRGLAPFEQMQRTWSTIVSARQSYTRLQDYLADAPNPRSTMIYPPPAGALAVETVTYAPSAGQRPIVQDVSFSVAPAQAVGIIGASASGKSSLARLLVGVWRPVSGSIRLDGIDVASWDRVDFGQHIGYVPQDVELLGGTVRENIARFSEASDQQVIEAAVAANAHELILRLPKGYDSDIGDHGMLLSGGQRQRLALARALFGNPTYIVLDEPNSNLDAEGEAAMLQALQRAKQRGAIILIVAHRPSLLSFVDKLLVMKDGRVELFGERKAVLARLQPKRPTVVPMAPPQSAREIGS